MKRTKSEGKADKALALLKLHPEVSLLLMRWSLMSLVLCFAIEHLCLPPAKSLHSTEGEILASKLALPAKANKRAR